MSDDELLDGLIEEGLSAATLGLGIPGEVVDRIRNDMVCLLYTSDAADD